MPGDSKQEGEERRGSLAHLLRRRAVPEEEKAAVEAEVGSGEGGRAGVGKVAGGWGVEGRAEGG